MAPCPFIEQRLNGIVKHTAHPDTVSVVQPLIYRLEQTRTDISLSLYGPDHTELANIHIEIGPDGKTPIMRVWDEEKGLWGEPVLTRQLVIKEPPV